MGAGYTVRARANDAAEIFIYEDIGDSWMGGVTAKQLADDLKAMGKVKTIDVRINSNGGDAFEGITMYRQLVEHPATITTHVDGIAASAASIIAMAGNTIRISEAGFLMIHDAAGVAMGNAKLMRQLADTLETVSGSIGDIYVSRTGQSAEQIRAWMEAETWFTAKDAVEKRFATEIAENMKVAAHVDAGRYRYKHVPELLAHKPTGSTAPTCAANANGSARPNYEQGHDLVQRMKARLTLGGRVIV